MERTAGKLRCKSRRGPPRVVFYDAVRKRRFSSFFTRFLCDRGSPTLPRRKNTGEKTSLREFFPSFARIKLVYKSWSRRSFGRPLTEESRFVYNRLDTRFNFQAAGKMSLAKLSAYFTFFQSWRKFGDHAVKNCVTFVATFAGAVFLFPPVIYMDKHFLAIFFMRNTFSSFKFRAVHRFCYINFRN